MNKNKVGVAVGHTDNIATDMAVHGMISAGLSQQTELIDVRMQARLRRARIKAVSVDRDVPWSARLQSAISVPAVMRMPVAQASVAMLMVVCSLSLVLTPGSPIESPTVNSAIKSVANNISGIKNSDAKLPQNSAQSLSEMDVLMSNEDMEFLENLEIYEWLAAEYG